ncbi:acyltransferase [Pedobacter sp. SL55]|uniref:acyltransferase n=1 Tax=Pedobacter sp. SL55 TaxID=2995161 RepID=UPI002D1E4900|nr:acyltransferase [Pedobacter sp. SL55]
MATLSYLWKNRAKFSILQKSFYRAWGKRLLTLKSLYLRNRRRYNLTRKGATIANTAEIGKIKLGGKTNNLTVGENTFIGNVELALHDKINIGNFVCINDGSVLLTASHDLSDPLWQQKKKPIIIQDYVWIATNAIILPGVKIGKGAVVGAGSVVTRDVKSYDIVGGNPAIPIGKKRVENLKYNPCEFLAANRAWLKTW